MRPRVRLLLGLGALSGLLVVAALLGSRRRATPGADQRPSTLLTLPNGASAVADAAGRLGVDVERLRRHELRGLTADTGRPRALVVLDPTLPLTGAQAEDLIELPEAGVSLVVAGPDARRLFRCFGFDTLLLADSMPVTGAGSAGPVAARTRLGIRATGEETVVDSTGLFDSVVRACTVPALRRLDTLATAAGVPVALRLAPIGSEATVTIVSETGLFRNRTVRDTDAGPMVLGWLTPFERLWFDEYHHGFFAGGSLVGWTLRWSRESPWGWLAWHVAIVGLIALAAAAVRFGPVVTVLDRRRRSVVEHVRALALALRATGGHGEALRLLVTGLRRRLAVGGRSGPEPWPEWLERLRGPNSPPAVAALATKLAAIDTTKPSEAEVLAAAKLVEGLWNEMKR